MSKIVEIFEILVEISEIVVEKSEIVEILGISELCAN